MSDRRCVAAIRRGPRRMAATHLRSLDSPSQRTFRVQPRSQRLPVRVRSSHLMAKVSGEIGAIACLKHVASIRCPHFHRTGEDEEHLLPVMLLPFAGWFGAHMDQLSFHHAALRREQLETIGTRVLHRPAPPGGAADAHGLVGCLLTEQQADWHLQCCRQPQPVSTEGRFVPRSSRDRKPLSRPAAAASVSTVNPFSRRICRKRGLIVGLIFVGSATFLPSSETENSAEVSRCATALALVVPWAS